MGAMCLVSPVSAAVYPTPVELIGDLVALQTEEIGEPGRAWHATGSSWTRSATTRCSTPSSAPRPAAGRPPS